MFEAGLFVLFIWEYASSKAKESLPSEVEWRLAMGIVSWLHRSKLNCGSLERTNQICHSVLVYCRYLCWHHKLLLDEVLTTYVILCPERYGLPNETEASKSSCGLSIRKHTKCNVQYGVGESQVEARGVCHFSNTREPLRRSHLCVPHCLDCVSSRWGFPVRHLPGTRSEFSFLCLIFNSIVTVESISSWFCLKQSTSDY